MKEFKPTTGELHIGKFQKSILIFLANSPRPINMTVLRSLFGLSSSTEKGYFSAWRGLQKLVRKNLVKRLQDNSYVITHRGRMEYDRRMETT